MMWFLTYPLSAFNAVDSSHFYMSRIGLAYGLPLAGIFYVFSLSNLGLMWWEVAQASKTMKKSGSNISCKALALTIAFSAVSGALLFVFLTPIGKIVVGVSSYLIGGALMIVILIIIGAGFLVGAYSLDTAMGKSGSARGAATTTMRKMSIWVKAAAGMSPKNRNRAPKIRLIIDAARRVATTLLLLVFADVACELQPLFGHR